MLCVPLIFFLLVSYFDLTNIFDLILLYFFFSLFFRKTIFKSDFSALSKDFSIPIFSTKFLYFLIPAVSINVNLSPCISSVELTKSVVVPGILVTIETSLLLI